MSLLGAYYHALAAWLDAASAVAISRLAGRPVSAAEERHAWACRQRLDTARAALCGERVA